MKAFVFGALLVQTLDAQVTDDVAATPDVTPTNEFAVTPTPLLTPGPNEPSETELSSEADAGIGGPGVAATADRAALAYSSEQLLVGTADVVITSTSGVNLSSIEPTSVDTAFDITSDTGSQVDDSGSTINSGAGSEPSTTPEPEVDGSGDPIEPTPFEPPQPFPQITDFNSTSRFPTPTDIADGIATTDITPGAGGASSGFASQAHGGS
ncbi:hypothetical protein EJ02DRAFT_435100 [Clathrospora elynae]|uniref:Cell wall protein n=1 Tax=Clathrospora elynae TaxID=706981 RepID=A0A6A5SN35_9PLEO|nr:hypothetical protein EJ02DRAFT_435100 [Clathrospora elynae]